jgi:hypothetical protein
MPAQLVQATYAPNNLYPYATSTYNIGDIWGFFTRNCTSYAAWKINVDYGLPNLTAKYFFNGMQGPNGVTGQFGTAYNWDNNATTIGYKVNNVPRRGAIAVWEISGASPSGHVAYVESVNPNGTVNVSEYNVTPAEYSERQNVIANSYIHIKNYYQTSFATNFDNDNKKDPTLFRPTSNSFYVKLSTTGADLSFVHGGVGDWPVPGDYDGDKKTDFAIFRPSDHNWYIYSSLTGQLITVPNGGYGDIPVPADYDGDTKTDVAIYRPSTGYWYIINSLTGSMTSLHHGGLVEDIPLIGYFDSDKKADPTIFRPSDHNWYTINSQSGNMTIFANGGFGDVPVPADYDGDGITDRAIFRATEHNWYIYGSKTNSWITINHGGLGDIPVSGDFDGDTKSDAAIYRPSDGNWYILQSLSGTMRTVHHGGGVADEVF